MRGVGYGLGISQVVLTITGGCFADDTTSCLATGSSGGPSYIFPNEFHLAE